MSSRPEKLRIQLELKLQADMIKSLHKQGWFATKTSDRFKAGRPDLRIAHHQYGQLDVELKYSFDDYRKECETGLKKLQWLKIKEMNEHGMPAVGLVFSEPLNMFFVTTVLREELPHGERCDRCFYRAPGAAILEGPVLFVKAMEHLNELGYRDEARNWRQAWPSSRSKR